MRRLFFLVGSVFVFVISAAQRETSHWFLNNSRVTVTPSGISNITPAGTPSGFNPNYGSTSVSDAAGNLLFACDGNTIIDKNLGIMPGMTGISLAARDKLLAAKVPGSTKYYIFYVQSSSYQVNAPWALKYALVDLSLNGGKGDVVSYNQAVGTDLSQGFALVQVEGSEDFWLVTHRLGTTTFLSYKITSAGLNMTPVTSNAGTVQTTVDYIFRDLKASHNGKMVAGIAYRDYTDLFAQTYQFLEVFDFNSATGQLTSKVRTTRNGGYFSMLQSVEFSPDNRLVYGGYMTRVDGLQPCGFGSGNIVQYNLCYSDSNQFVQNSMVIASDFQFCGPRVSWARIQLGADKKIYMPYTGTMISRINNPNRIGSYCNLEFDAHRVSNSNYATVITPTFHHKLLEKAVKNNIAYSGGCFPNPINFKITNDTITDIHWDFGDPLSTSNTSTLATPQHVFSVPGFYTVTAQLHNSNGELIETVNELVQIKDPQKRLLASYPSDTSFCSGNSLKLKLNVVNGIFRWLQRSPWDGKIYYSSTSDSFTISSSGDYFVEMRQNDCDACVMIDSIHVTVLPVPYINLGYDKNLCTGDSLQLSVNDPSADYIWSTGETSKDIWIHGGGIYWVQGEFAQNGCPKRDSVVITSVPGVQFSLPNDTTLCNNATLLLNPGVVNANYVWQNNTNTVSYTVSQPGTYWVQITNSNYCRRADTVNVSYVNAQQVFLGNDTTLCQSDSLVLTTVIGNARYSWSNGSSSSSIAVKQPGTYWLKVDNGSCTVSDTITVSFSVKPSFSLGNDTSLCEKQKLILRANVPNASYLWSGGAITDSLVINQQGNYWLQVAKGGCMVRDTIVVNYMALPVVNLGNDTSICTNTSLLLNAYHPSIQSYAWQNGSSQQTFLAQTGGIYWVKTIGMNGCINTDSVSIATLPLPSFTLGKDTTLCEGQMINYNFAITGASYLWNNSVTTNSFSIGQPGVYWLTVTQNGCSKTDSISVLFNPLPRLSIGNDTTLCEGQTIFLNAYNPNASYHWSTGGTTDEIMVNKPGTYTVSVDVDNCIAKDTMQVFYISLPHFSLGADTLLCNGQSIVLDPKFSIGVRYLWQDGSTNKTYTVKQPGTYSLQITNSCGTTSDAIVVENGVCNLYMPTAFTPNNDGHNDVFKVKYPQFIKKFTMQIFNRWGELIFSGTNPYQGWNGTYQNREQPAGAYIWMISLVDLDGNSSNYKGTVMLIH